MSEVEEKVKSIISKIINIDPISLDNNSGLNNITEWDSLNHTIIILTIEEELDIDFDFDEFDKLTTIGAIKNSINQKNISSC